MLPEDSKHGAPSRYIDVCFFQNSLVNKAVAAVAAYANTLLGLLPRTEYGPNVEYGVDGKRFCFFYRHSVVSLGESVLFFYV